MFNQKLIAGVKSVYRKIKFFEKLFNHTKINSEEANNKICSIWKKEYPEFSQNNIVANEYDLMVIIAVYNTGKYLDECIQSFISQNTHYSTCAIIVNDGSTDDSLEVLQKYYDFANIKIINQENRGFSGARNRALEKIIGKYIMFLDSDDILFTNAIEKLMNVAVEKNADIVAGGYNIFSEKGVTKSYTFGESIRRVLPGEVPGFTCMKVIRSELVKNFCFPEGYLFEDTVISKLIYPKCKYVYTIPDIVYSYRIRTESISQSYDKKTSCIDTFWITKYCLEESIKRDYPLDEYTYKEYLKQCYINYLRTRYLPQKLQECLFILTADLLEKYWKNIIVKTPNKFNMLDKALKKRSFTAFCYVLDHWELL